MMTDVEVYITGIIKGEQNGLYRSDSLQEECLSASLSCSCHWMNLTLWPCWMALQALDIVPEKIHDRSPIFLGSYEDVEEIKFLYAECAKETASKEAAPPTFHMN